MTVKYKQIFLPNNHALQKKTWESWMVVMSQQCASEEKAKTIQTILTALGRALAAVQGR